MKTTRIFLIMIAALSFLSCDDETIDNEQILRVMGKAKETQSIGVNAFKLEAYVWRDYMPIIPEEGRGIASVNWLVSTDSTPIPDHISIVKQYVIHKNEIWEADYEDEEYPTHAYKVERISRNGPQWETGIKVTVVAQVYDSEAKADYYLKCENVRVHRTD